MVLTAAQTTAFFEDAAQMGLPNRTRTGSLQAEGIVNPEDMAEWENTDWDVWADNAKKPPKIQDPAAGAAPGDLINQVPFTVPVKSLKRLKLTSRLIRHYIDTDRPLTVGNIKWLNVGKNFEIQRKALDAKAKEDKPSPPKMTQKMKIPKWNDNFVVHLSKMFGSRGCSLSYLIRADANVAAAAPPLMPNQPYTVSGSIESDMTERLSHDHALFPMDNATLYAVLDEALRGTIYEASIKPFERRRDGRGAYLALIAQHAGKDKWLSIIDDAEKYINEKRWDGTASFTLQSHIERCRSAYVELETASQHVQFQLPNERTRVAKLLTSIENCCDPKVSARHAGISDDSNGMSQDFEKAAAYLLPVCPVAKRVGNKRKSAQISGVGGANLIPRGPRTNVEIRYYKPQEFRELPNDKKQELLELRPSRGDGTPRTGGKGRGNQTGSRNNRFKKGKWDKQTKREIAALVKAEKVKWEKSKETEQTSIREIAEVLAGLKEHGKAGSASVAAAQAKDGEESMAAAIKLNAIMKKRRGSS